MVLTPCSLVCRYQYSI